MRGGGGVGPGRGLNNPPLRARARKTIVPPTPAEGRWMPPPALLHLKPSTVERGPVCQPAARARAWRCRRGTAGAQRFAGAWRRAGRYGPTAPRAPGPQSPAEDVSPTPPSRIQRPSPTEERRPLSEAP